VIVPGWGAPVFQENFSAATVNTAVWEVANRANDANGEAQYYHPSQVSVSNGTLRLRADNDPNYTHGKPYNSGLVRTWQEWSHGRFEARAKVPYGQGFWPAVWLLPRTTPWPAGGEIDIMEARGDLPYRMSSALHWGYDSNSRQYRSEWYESGANFQAGFHDYAVEWEVGTVRFYVDGVEHMRLYEPDVGIPSTPKSLILNLAVGGNYSGYPNGSTPFPGTFEIDYVRVWQRSPTIPPPVSLLTDPGFESGGGSLDAWQRFGNTIGNVSSDHGTPRDGERSLKLYGQFNGQTNASGAFQGVAVAAGDRVRASAHTLIRSEDLILGSANRAEMKLEFYNQSGGAYGSSQFLGESAVTIANGSSPQDTWSRFEIEALAPAGAVEARLVFAFVQPQGNQGGAVFVDSVSLTTSPPGDYNSDGTVTQDDYTVWRNAYGSTANLAADGNGDGAVNAADFTVWRDRVGAPPAQSTAASVPEPATAWFVGIAMATLGMGSFSRRY
jgi:beta-glucanase (GH16 family)